MAKINSFPAVYGCVYVRINDRAINMNKQSNIFHRIMQFNTSK